MKYDKKKKTRLLSDPTPIKSLPEGTKVLRPLIANSIKECDCFDEQNVFARHCENGSSQIKGIDFDQSYSPGAHYYSFIINIAIADMHRITARIIDVSNAFKNNKYCIKYSITLSYRCLPPLNYICALMKYGPSSQFRGTLG